MLWNQDLREGVAVEAREEVPTRGTVVIETRGRAAREFYMSQGDSKKGYG